VKLFAERRIGAVGTVIIAGLVIGLPGVGGTSAGIAVAAPMSPQDDVLDQAQGEAALAEARDHMAAGRWASAEEKYAEALRLMPGNPEALAGIRQAQTYLDRGATIEEVEQEIQVLREQARVEFDNKMQRSSEQLAQNDFDGALQLALTAQIQLRQNRRLFPESEYNQRNEAASEQLARIESAREVARLALEEQQRLEALRRQQEAADAEERKIETEINERLRRVRELQQAQKWEEALQIIDEILFFDERHPTALMLKDVFEVTWLYQRYSDLTRRKEGSVAHHELDGLEKMVFPRPNRSGPGPRGLNDILQYPEDWPGISILRAGETGFADTPENRAVDQRIHATDVPVDFTNNSLEQVLAFVEQVSGLKIYVDWKALDLIGVDREDEISLQLADVSVATALERVLEQLGDEVDRPQYAIQDGILTVSSDEALRRRKATVVYDIRDLLFEVPYYDNAPDLDLDSALSQGFGNQGGGGGGSGGGGGGGSLFGDPGDDPDRLSREELVEQIVSILQETVDPDGWVDNGGDTGTLQEFNGNLIIGNTPRNHRLIDGLLSQLREIRALQINIETRVLTVSTDWFERIGVDLDLFFNTNNTVRQQQLAVDPLGHLSDFFTSDGQLKDPLIFDSLSQTNFDQTGQGPTFPGEVFANQVNYGQAFGVPTGGPPPTDITYITGPVGAPIRTTSGFSPIPFVQNSLSLLDVIGGTTEFASNILGAGTPALVTGLKFLDDIQVDLLIEATQADRRSLVLTAPRLTFFNGQRAWIAVTTQTAFVSGLTPITGDSVGAFQPIVSALSEGFVLDVEAVISSDRRYVTINVQFDQAELQGFRQTSAQGAAGGGFGGGGGGVGTFEATIDLPIIEGAFIRTTVSVPDKGTVLLGGQRTSQEFETETGVPVLSKIPFINRFFTNRQTSKEEQTLLMLIRPEIIIQQENEDILFPGLSDTLGGSASMGLR
jgi:general secretion pathway protein D